MHGSLCFFFAASVDRLAFYDNMDARSRRVEFVPRFNAYRESRNYTLRIHTTTIITKIILSDKVLRPGTGIELKVLPDIRPGFDAVQENLTPARPGYGPFGPRIGGYSVDGYLPASRSSKLPTEVL